MAKEITIKLSDKAIKELYDLEMSIDLWQLDYDKKPTFEEYKQKKFKDNPKGLKCLFG